MVTPTLLKLNRWEKNWQTMWPLFLFHRRFKIWIYIKLKKRTLSFNKNGLKMHITKTHILSAYVFFSESIFWSRSITESSDNEGRLFLMIYVSWIRGDLSLFSLKQLALELEKDSFFFFPSCQRKVIMLVSSQCWDHHSTCVISVTSLDFDFSVWKLSAQLIHCFSSEGCTYYFIKAKCDI